MKKLVLVLMLALMSVVFTACGSDTTTRLGHDVPKAASQLVLPPTGDGLRDELNYYRDTPISDADYNLKRENVLVICSGDKPSMNRIMKSVAYADRNHEGKVGTDFAEYAIAVDYQCKQFSKVFDTVTSRWMLKDFN